MPDQKTTTLTTVLSEVLADLAFMFTDDGEFEPCVSQQWLETAISYDGSTSGTLRLACTRAFATQLATNLLGMELDEGTTEQASNDAVKEFMNVICGQYVTAVYGTEEVFNLTIPTVVERPTAPAFEDPEAVQKDMTILSVDGQLIQLLHARRV